MKIKLIIITLMVVLAGCSNNKTTAVNPLAIRALAGPTDYTVEVMLKEM